LVAVDFTLLFCAALVLMLLTGRPLISWLRAKRWRKGTTVDETWTVREDTPDTHQAKQGTPSMGGIGIIGVAIFAFIAPGAVLLERAFKASPTLSEAPIASAPPAQFWVVAALLPLIVAAHALLGFADGWSKASGRGGLRARAKLMVQIVLAVGFVLALLVLSSLTRYADLSFAGAATLLAAVIVSVFVIIATSNAVNLTDGIDGLVAGLTVQCGIAFLLIGAGAPSVGLAASLFWAALSGASLGFLWFNKHPARVFMGDTGSLAIGAALGAGGVLTGATFLLPFIGFIFYVEMFSVIIQVLYFKWTKKTRGEGQRIFRRAPLHHHFELGGWSERRVVGAFWLINAVTSGTGLILWNMELLPRWP
jgi:phospho-N-acetylmuramoyl-pentapeptide-transferase